MQLQLSAAEITKIGNMVEEVFNCAKGEHSRRMDRFRRYYRLWRHLTDEPKAGDEDASNYQVPMMEWQVFSAWADLMHGWLGKGAEVVAEPTAPYDQKIVRDVSTMMTWRVFSYMKIIRPASISTFRAIINGRSHVYIPWDQEKGKRGELWYDGPKYIPLWPDDFVVPAEDAATLHEFSWVIHKERLTPQQLLDGERAEKYFGIESDFENVLRLATSERSGVHGDEILAEKDEAEGVTRDYSQAAGNTITVLHWYGRRRLPLGDGDADVDETSIKGRELDETEILVHYALELNRVIGVQNLEELYAKSRYKRPFGEIAFNEDGSYWCKGFGEMLEDANDELSANHNLFTDAGEFGVGPVIFASPAAGLNAKNFRYEPRTVIPTENPEKIKIVNFNADMNYSITKEHAMLSYVERLTGRSDQALGRSSDRPNAPRTASGQVLLAEFSNLRSFLDSMFFREHLEAHLKHIWTLEQQFAPEGLFFRVTENDAPGSNHGWKEMPPEAYGAGFDFTLKFAPSPWMKQAQEQKQLQLYGIDMQNPLIVQNPQALWRITNNVHKALGDDNFADLVPEPPDAGVPIDPKREWAMLQQGDLPEVNPLDNDDLHLADHMRRLEMEQESSNDSPMFLRAAAAHIQEHVRQRQQKVLMQTMMSNLVNSLPTMPPIALPEPVDENKPVGVRKRADQVAGEI
jgi:hypothetical protein